MEAEGLEELDVAESILNAVANLQEDTLYESVSQKSKGISLHHSEPKSDGIAIYTKGKFVREAVLAADTPAAQAVLTV